MIDQRSATRPAPQAGNVHFEDVPLLLGAIVSERVLGAVRSLAPDGSWQWTFPDPKCAGVEDAPRITANQPPLIVDDRHIDVVLYAVDNFAANGKRFYWRFGASPIPPGAPPVERWYTCDIFEPDGSGTRVSTGSAETRTAAIALAMARLAGADIMAVHREMFPGRYMALQS